MMATFKMCLENRRIIRFPEAVNLVEPELEDAADDLQSAKQEFQRDGFKWATIKGYYALFHAARALLHSAGYRERGHYCLYLAIQELFVKPGKFEEDLVEGFKNAMVLREDADYSRNFSKNGAAATIKCAERFLKQARQILKDTRAV